VTRVEIRQRRSAIGEKESARRTLGALGLRRTGQIVSHDDTPALRGKLRRVAHLVTVSDAVDTPKAKESR
jgi:large subunit ribosomal protein L30